MHLRVLKSKYLGWKHSIQFDPLKKVFYLGHMQSALCKLYTLPPVQLTQSPNVKFQKVGATHATHLSPLNFGLSFGQLIQDFRFIS
mgnify:FL=1